MSDPLRERLTALITKWRDVASRCPYDNINREGQRLDQCADEIEAPLRAVPAGEVPPDDASRCAVCGWPLSERVARGCVRGNCSQRPLPDRFYAPARARREYAPHLDRDPRAAAPEGQ